MKSSRNPASERRSLHNNPYGGGVDLIETIVVLLSALLSTGPAVAHTCDVKGTVSTRGDRIYPIPGQNECVSRIALDLLRERSPRRGMARVKNVGSTTHACVASVLDTSLSLVCSSLALGGRLGIH